MKRSRRWQITIVVVMLLLCAASLLLVSRTQSRWNVSIDAASWRIYKSEDRYGEIPMTTQVTILNYHFGRLTISSERTKHLHVGTNGVVVWSTRDVNTAPMEKL